MSVFVADGEVSTAARGGPTASQKAVVAMAANIKKNSLKTELPMRKAHVRSSLFDGNLSKPEDFVILVPTLWACWEPSFTLASLPSLDGPGTVVLRAGRDSPPAVSTLVCKPASANLKLRLGQQIRCDSGADGHSPDGREQSYAAGRTFGLVASDCTP